MKIKNSYPLLLLFSFFLASLNVGGQVCPLPEVNLGNDTLICPDGSMYLDAGLHASVVWNDESTGRYLLVTKPGIYSVKVQNVCGNTATDTIIIELALAPEVKITYPERVYFCKGELVNLAAEVVSSNEGIIYEWIEKNSTDASVSVDTSGTYTLNVTNNYGCKSTRMVNLEFQYPYEEEKILLSTFDPTEGKNILIWSKTPEKRTQSFFLYAGNTQNDFLSEASYSGINLYVDTNSDPATRPSVYNFQVMDSCNNRSLLRVEKAHKTMYLNAFTDVNGNATLEWNPYQGFSYNYFYIYQGTDPAKLVLIDSVAYDPKADIMRYIDKTAREGVLYYYDIRVRTPETIYLDNPTRKKAGSGPFVHSLSNLEDNMIRLSGMNELDIMDQYFRISPNPAKGKIIITCRTEKMRNMNFQVFDITGKKVAFLKKERFAPGEFSVEFTPSDLGMVPGIYMLRMDVEDLGIITRKIITY